MHAERIRSMETDLERVAGVDSARIRAEDGEITEVHIVSDPGRRPKWVVRDVITTLYARHGIRVPHQRISVAGSAPVEGVEPGSDPPAPGERILVSCVHLTREGERLRAVVELQEGERTVRGTWDGLATRANHQRVVAEAALEAVRRLTDGLDLLHLEEVRRIDLGALSVVLVHVVLLRGGQERPLVGSCPAGEGQLEAAAGAVLDAVDQILPPARPPAEEIEYQVEEEAES